MTDDRLFQIDPILTDRQAFAHDALRRATRDGGLEASEVGALLHARKGIHHAEARCRYCPREGLTVLDELRAKNLAVFQSRHWIATREPIPTPPGMLPDDQPIPY